MSGCDAACEERVGESRTINPSPDPPEDAEAAECISAAEGISQRASSPTDRAATCHIPASEVSENRGVALNHLQQNSTHS